MSFVGGEIAWRLPIAFQLFFAIGVIILVFALPESPRWRLMKGRDQEAIDVLCQFHDKDPSDPSILAETSSIQRAIELELSSNTGDSFFSIFKQDNIGNRYRILLAWGVQSMELHCRHDHPSYHQSSAVEGVSYFHGY